MTTVEFRPDHATILDRQPKYVSGPLVDPDRNQVTPTRSRELTGDRYRATGTVPLRPSLDSPVGLSWTDRLNPPSAHGYESTRLTKSPVRSGISVTSGLRHQHDPTHENGSDYARDRTAPTLHIAPTI